MATQSKTEKRKLAARKDAPEKTPVKKTPAKQVKRAPEQLRENKAATATAAEISEKRGKYIAAVGRRKQAIAQVRLFTSGGEILINNRSIANYFPIAELQKIVAAPLETMHLTGKVGASVIVRGGGLRGQAEAVRLGISRALVEYNPDFRKRLKRVGFLTRDARVKERKKYGLKKARRAPQWQKR